MQGGRPDGTIALAEVRLLRRAQAGEPVAREALWQAWRDRCWSVCRAMGADRDQALDLLRAVYLELPGALRGAAPGEPLCCLVGCHVYRVVRGRLELAGLGGIPVTVPDAVRTPDGAAVTRIVAAMHPPLRLVYLVDLFFGCPASKTAALVGEDEVDLRSARSAAAWTLVAGEGG